MRGWLGRLWRRNRAPVPSAGGPPPQRDPALEEARLREQQLNARITYLETERTLMRRRNDKRC